MTSSKLRKKLNESSRADYTFEARIAEFIF